MSALSEVLRRALAQRLEQTAGRWPRAMFGEVNENAARLARAREQGFNTNQVWYHGTQQNFPEFRPSEGSFGRGVYVSRNPDKASGYAQWGENMGGEGGNVLPVYLRQGRFRRTLHQDAMVPDPSDIRSVFAQFDPAKAKSSDLLAGVAIGVPTAALTLREMLRGRMIGEA